MARWFVPASLFACLVSPHHVFALRLPMELSPAVWSSGFPSDPRFAISFLSPWHLGPLGSAGGYNLAVWAFFILFALGLISFACNRRALASWRGVVWLSFALLAGWQARLVPFFAVVAGPITVLNLCELRCASWRPRLGRGFVLTLSLTLVGLGWLGWTNGLRNRDRGAGWAVHTDATLERAAAGIAKWRAKNTGSPDAQVFTSHQDLSHYLAWFAPGEKSFLDVRLQLFTSVMSDYANLSQAVGLLPGHDRDAELPHELMERHRIKAIALYDPDIRRMTAALRTVFRGERSRWVLTRIDGGVVFIVPRAAGEAASGFDPERAAFGVSDEDDVRTLYGRTCSSNHRLRGTSSPLEDGAVPGRRTPRPFIFNCSRIDWRSNERSRRRSSRSVSVNGTRGSRLHVARLTPAYPLRPFVPRARD